MSKPEQVPAALAHDSMFAIRDDGEAITREQTCECGQQFTQRLLSARFMAAVEHHSRHAAHLVTQQIPGLFVPVHCPPCERRDLTFGSRIADARQSGGREEPRDIFGGRDAAD